jgi:phosphohistidine phosphatase
MEILLLRHGIAVEREDHTGPDEERALTDEGRRKVRRVAEAMRAMKLSFDVIFSSPLARALQTAEIVAEILRLRPRLQLTEHLGSGASPAKQISWLKNLRPAPASVLLVGHEPNFSELTSRLLTGRDNMSIHFKKAGLGKLTFGQSDSRRATLEWFLTPKQMEMMRP